MQRFLDSMEKRSYLKRKLRILIFTAVAAAAAALILLGIFRGEPSVILQNAINVCLECIGLGK